MSEARSVCVIVTAFIDAKYVGNKLDRKDQVVVKATIHWYSKKQNTVQSSTDGAEFSAMQMIEEL